MSVTIKDIAKAAGVSHTTVSRALRDSPVISAATAAQIKQLAQQMGYVPNSAARNLKTNRSNAFGVIVQRIDDPFYGEVIDGIEDVLQSRGYSLLLAASHGDSEKEKEIFRTLSERRVDGTIICSIAISQAQAAQLDHFGVPIVVINNQAANDTTYAVSHDDNDGATQIVQHLLDLGHQNIAYIGNASAGRTNEDRLNAFHATLQTAGVDVRPEWVVNAPNGSVKGGVRGAQMLLRQPERPTAVVCFNDVMAVGAMSTLKGAGIGVPENCAVTGFDNIALAEYLCPPLTTFDQPKYELGQRAAQMMLSVLERKRAMPAQPQSVCLRGTLIVRESTAPLPKL